MEKDRGTMDNNLVEQHSSSRRSALLFGGAALAGALLASKASAQSTVTDTDILNFALNLEYLEAQFYTLAATGMTLQQAGIGTAGGSGAAAGSVVVKANPMVPFSTPLLQQFATEVMMDEQNHALHSRDWKGVMRRYYAMSFGERYIWGVTAGILRNLYERMYGVER